MSRTENRDKLERIRQAREPTNMTDDGPTLYECPIDGCSRTVIGEPGHLRNHVRQSSDDAHRHRTLSEDLEVETEWSAMNWGPGAPL